MIDRERPTDVTRDHLGRLRWSYDPPQHESDQAPTARVPQRPTSESLLGEYRDIFAPELGEQTHPEIPRGGSLAQLWTTAARRKRWLVFGGVSALVVIGALTMLPRSGSTSQDSNASVTAPSATGTGVEGLQPEGVANSETETVSEFQEATTATQAIYNFLRGGHIARLGELAQLPENDITVSVINRSGDLVLADVAVRQASGTKEIASLLLQKIEGEWQIREVY